MTRLILSLLIHVNRDTPNRDDAEWYLYLIISGTRAFVAHSSVSQTMDGDANGLKIEE